LSKTKHCDCQHALKHHKSSGRCRGKCRCQAAAIKAIQKRR